MQGGTRLWKRSRDLLYEIDVLKDCSLAGCVLIRIVCGGVSKFHFGPFLPVLFGAAPASGHAPSRKNEGGGSPTRQHQGERSAAEGCTK